MNCTLISNTPSGTHANPDPYPNPDPNPSYKHAILAATEGAAVAALATDEDAKAEAEEAWDAALGTLDTMRDLWFAEQPDAWTELALRV